MNTQSPYQVHQSNSITYRSLSSRISILSLTCISVFCNTLSLSYRLPLNCSLLFAPNCPLTHNLYDCIYSYSCLYQLKHCTDYTYCHNIVLLNVIVAFLLYVVMLPYTNTEVILSFSPSDSHAERIGIRNKTKNIS